MTSATPPTAPVRIPLTVTQRLADMAARCIDLPVQALAWMASKVSPVRGAGFFYYPELSARWDAWSAPGAWTLLMGRFELVVDLKD